MRLEHFVPSLHLTSAWLCRSSVGICIACCLGTSSKVVGSIAACHDYRVLLLYSSRTLSNLCSKSFTTQRKDGWYYSVIPEESFSEHTLPTSLVVYRWLCWC